MWVASFTARQLYLRYPQKSRLDGPQGCSGRVWRQIPCPWRESSDDSLAVHPAAWVNYPGSSTPWIHFLTCQIWGSRRDDYEYCCVVASDVVMFGTIKCINVSQTLTTSTFRITKWPPHPLRRWTYFPLVTGQIADRNSSVGIATCYGLNGPGIESRWGRDFPQPSRPVLRPTQPPIQ
jgi:hypothetical protein